MNDDTPRAASKQISENKNYWPWLLVLAAHAFFASSVILALVFCDSKDSDTERKLRQTLEFQEQRITQQSDEIARLRHQLFVLAAEWSVQLEPESTEETE